MKVEQVGNKYRVRKMYKGVVYVIHFDHEPDEKEVLIAVAKKLEEGSTIERGSFEEFAKKYIKNRTNVTSPSTIRTYNTKLSQLSEDFRKKKLVDITGDNVQEEINRLAEKYEPKTVKTTHGFVASILGAYRPNLRLKTKLPQAIKKEKYEPSNKDIKRILKEVQGTEFSVAFQLGVWGCRVGEICALSIEDLQDNSIRIHRNLVYTENNEWVIKDNPKTDESNRILPLSQKLADEIREQGYIYKGYPNSLNKALHRIQKKLGIPAFTFHELRHYFASYAHSLGIPDADILSIGGWKTDNVMKRIYRNSIEESKQQSLEILSKKLLK